MSTDTPSTTAEAIAGLCEQFPEINPSNYGEDEVAALNAWGIEAHAALEALAREKVILTDREFIDHEGEPVVTSDAALQEILHQSARAEAAEARLAEVEAENRGLKKALSYRNTEDLTAARARIEALENGLKDAVDWFAKAEADPNSEYDDPGCDYLNGDDRPIGENGWTDGKIIFRRAAALINGGKDNE